MSINPFPSCNTSNPSACAGFNQDCFIPATGGGADPAGFLQFPIGQGVETLPGLITIGDIDVGENIVMTGTEGINYIEFPDGTRQYTAYTGTTTTNNVFTIDGNTLVSPSTYLMNPITINYPAGTKSFSAYCFSGAGNNLATVQFTPNPAVTGQNLTYQPSATSNSGSGAVCNNVPVKSGISNAAQIVFQPNLTPARGDVNSSVIWGGGVNLNPATFVATLNTTQGNASNIIAGTQLVISAPKYGCPSSVVLTNNVGGNNSVWNYIQGSASSYYVAQSGLTGFVYNSVPNRWRGNLSISGNVLTVSSNAFGTLGVGWYVIGAGFAVITSSQTNSTTFVVKGCSSGFVQTTTVGYGFAMNNGMDAVLAVYSANVTPTAVAIVRGSNAPTSASPTAGGSITSYGSGLSVTSYASTSAVTSTTSSGIYPTIATNTQLAVQNSGAVQLGALPNASIITNCANSNQKITTFPAGGQPTIAQTLGGLGGFGVIFSSV
jgi:hypothetical protein